MNRHLAAAFAQPKSKNILVGWLPLLQRWRWDKVTMGSRDIIRSEMARRRKTERLSRCTRYSRVKGHDVFPAEEGKMFLQGNVGVEGESRCMLAE